VNDGTCNNIERVSAYHDGELSAAAAAEIERHVAGCDTCASELERYRVLTRRFASAELPRLPSSARRRIRRAIDDERAAGRLRIVRALTAIAASVFLVTASQVIYLQNGRGGTASSSGDAPGVSRVMRWDLSAAERAVRQGSGGGAAGPADVPVLLPTAVTPEASFAQDMLDGLEKDHD
jgi:anti-sigma factor RsiW